MNEGVGGGEQKAKVLELVWWWSEVEKGDVISFNDRYSLFHISKLVWSGLL